MLLSPGQQNAFWRLWNEVCDVQGWIGAEKEIRRKEVLAELGFGSLRLVNRAGGYDRLKAALERLAYRLPGGLAATYPDLGEMRRHVHLIRSKYIPGLASILGAHGAAAYVAAICQVKWGWDRPWPSLADDASTGPERIRHLLYTLAARLSAKGGPAEIARPAPAAVDKPLIFPPSGPASGQIPPN